DASAASMRTEPPGSGHAVATTWPGCSGGKSSARMPALSLLTELRAAERRPREGGGQGLAGHRVVVGLERLGDQLALILAEPALGQDRPLEVDRVRQTPDARDQ